MSRQQFGARQAGSERIVFLSNDSEVLPLSGSAASVSLFGLRDQSPGQILSCRQDAVRESLVVEIKKIVTRKFAAENFLRSSRSELGE